MGTSVTFEANGFAGMAASYAAKQTNVPLQILNGYLESPSNPQSAVVARPGWYRLSTTQMGSSEPAIHSGLVFQFEKLDGTGFTVLVTRGVFYKWTWGTGLAEALSAATLSAASVAISATATVYACMFNNQMVITDGVNTPWMWDGTTNGGITKLTNAPVAYGPPTVYYARLFFIKNADRGTGVWSEVNAANTGYEAGGYNNAWTLSQTASSPLIALLGTNDGLYYFRAKSIGLIRGAVTSTFSTSGTHDAVSADVGLGHALMLAFYQETIFFTDTQMRPWRMALGGRPDPLWSQADWFFGYKATIYKDPVGFAGPGVLLLPGNLPAAASATVEIVPRPWLNQVCFVYTTVAYESSVVVYDVTTGKLVGLENWADTTNSAYIVRVGVGGYPGGTMQLVAITNNRTAVTQGSIAVGSALTFEDQLTTGSTHHAYSLSVFTARIGDHPSKEYDFGDLDVVVEFPEVTGYTLTVGAAYVTSNRITSGAEVAEQTVALTAGGSSLIRQRRAEFGLSAGGRWIMWRLRVIGTTTTERVALVGWAQDAWMYRGSGVLR